MFIPLKRPRAIARMKEAGRIVAECFDILTFWPNRSSRGPSWPIWIDW
jgi:hypothetical protein